MNIFCSSLQDPILAIRQFFDYVFLYGHAFFFLYRLVLRMAFSVRPFVIEFLRQKISYFENAKVLGAIPKDLEICEL